MRLMVLGMDHRSTPAALRERLAFAGTCHERGLAALKARFPTTEFVLLSTCNRVEIYASDDATALGCEDLISFLARFHEIPDERVAGHASIRYGDDVVRHLFRVAAGLESLVPGEDQILGQVRHAYKAASERAAAGPILHAVFQRALRAGKRARDETGLGREKLSVPGVAVELAREVMGRPGEKTALVIGAGRMGSLILRHLAESSPAEVLVTNRDFARAGALAEVYAGRAIPFDQLDAALIQADVVISATAAAQPIVSYDRLSRIQQARHDRPLVVIDIAMPPDFEPGIGELERVRLFTLDDLQSRAEQGLPGRRARIDRAAAVVEGETAACIAALRGERRCGDLLRRLGDRAEVARRRELDKLFTAQSDLTEDQRTAISHAMSRFCNQLLHHPRCALRQAAEGDGSVESLSLLDAARRVFGLANDSTRDRDCPSSAPEMRGSIGD